MNTLTLINLETLREVEARLGRPLDPRRFRANIVVDGLPAWSEFDWIGRSVDFAEAGFQAVSRVRRCAAVDVDPRTARRDGSFWVAMVRAYGHVDFGVHLSVRVGGDISVGDPLAAEIPGPVELPA
nr:MOSC domain-containing protein [Chthonobacter rhizosphaerae]